MNWYVKTEQFKKSTLNLSVKKRKYFINQHKEWVKIKKSSGMNIFSGYLIDKNKKPGGGGLLLLESESYLKAEEIIRQDPMITNKLVEWKLEELIPIENEFNEHISFILDDLSSTS